MFSELGGAHVDLRRYLAILKDEGITDIRLEKGTEIERIEGRRRNPVNDWLFRTFVPKMEGFQSPLFLVPVFSLPCSGLLLLGEQQSTSPCIARSLPPSTSHQEMRSGGKSRTAKARELRPQWWATCRSSAGCEGRGSVMGPQGGACAPALHGDSLLRPEHLPPVKQERYWNPFTVKNEPTRPNASGRLVACHQEG